MKRIILTLTFVLFVIPIGISQDLPSYVPTDGLIAYYPFNGNANDESGNENNGVVDGATLTTDRFENNENAYNFDGLETFITLPNDFFNGAENGIYTINFWTKYFQENTTIFYKGGSWKESAISITSEKKVEYSFKNGTNSTSNFLTSNTSLERDKWYNITIIHVSGEIKLFINGTFETQLQINDVVDWSTSINTQCAGVGMHFGKNYNNCTRDMGYYGVIDDFGIWDRGLSEQEIQNLYTSSTGDILLNGTVSAESNQIKNVADPTDAQDAATKSYVDSNVNAFSGSYSDLTDTPTSSMAFQLPMLTTAQRDEIVASLGMMIYNIDVNEFQGFQNYEKQLPAEIDQQHLTINNGGGENRAQSFTSSATGELTLVKLPLSVMMESIISLSFKIIEGEGVNGTVLFETSYYLTNSNQEWIEFGISGVNVISGNLYTIQLIEENSGCGMPPCYTWGMDTSGNNYSGGQFFYNGTPYSNGEYDSAFITYVSSEELVNEWITLH